MDIVCVVVCLDTAAAGHDTPVHHAYRRSCHCWLNAHGWSASIADFAQAALAALAQPSVCSDRRICSYDQGLWLEHMRKQDEQGTYLVPTLSPKRRSLRLSTSEPWRTAVHSQQLIGGSELITGCPSITSHCSGAFFHTRVDDEYPMMSWITQCCHWTAD